ncbi:unnamed protein product [Adineta steineri]|uniref:Uncharacterized protein n=1 Tax=Adineta steineri TaxID=433720 RepID=A0A818T7L9_9BILA|nr:unnamed protein product [Adineta steineri]CAF1116314.1 unnamed protein product [Adineta steineri]CAF3677963.1 unnamed protein product [Adineta steineri]CAF3736572.1 unnamed protein product [Adineta steineri]CAF3750937.1 unnamed protein product [Adineta steineri]
MNCILNCIFLLTILIVFNIQLSSTTSSRRSCPEEYRELRRRNDDDSNSDSNDDDDDEQMADMCSAAMVVATEQPNSIQNLEFLRTYCAHFDEALELARESNDTLCEDKKRAIVKKSLQRRGKRGQMKKKRDEYSNDSYEDKRRALRKRELHKRFALRFVHK